MADSIWVRLERLKAAEPSPAPTIKMVCDKEQEMQTFSWDSVPCQTVCSSCSAKQQISFSKWSDLKNSR